MSRLLGTVAAAALVVLAAPPTVAASPAQPLAAPNPAPAAPRERARQLARDVLIASGSDSRLVNASDATIAEAMRALNNALPGAKPEWRPAMEQAVRDELRAFGERLFEGNVDIYASRFTEPQLADMLAFYQTPSGRALASQSAAITRDRLMLSRKYGADLLPHMVAAVCAKFICAPLAPAPAPGRPEPGAGAPSATNRPSATHPAPDSPKQGAARDGSRP